jgi:small subunit ribosomal protein S16
MEVLPRRCAEAGSRLFQGAQQQAGIDLPLTGGVEKRSLCRSSPRITMSVSLRLTRVGAKKAPFYRIVAADSRSPRDGRFIEQIGIFNPLRTPPELRLDVERANFWLKNGAQASDTVDGLLRTARKAPEAK